MLRILRIAVLIAAPAVGLAPVWARPDRASLAKKKDLKKKRGAAAPASKRMVPLDLSQPAQPSPSGGGAIVAPPLDLSNPLPAGSDDKAKARQEMMAPAAKGGIDFGGGFDMGGEGAGDVNFDFGSDQPALDLGGLNMQSAERTRFDAAITLMTDEEYDKAALEFQVFLADKAYAEFEDESQYQLGKALYKLGFLDGALRQYQAILEKGPPHRRYRKAVEWLFFMSRKLADQTPVLAQLARYRNVTFPKAYRNEYNYLLAKYLFVQADNFEVKRLQDEELARGKKSKENTLDFGAIADAIGSPSNTSMDFSQIGGAEALDFNAGDGGFDFGGAGSLDFGGAPEAPPGGGLDFGAPAAPGGDGGLDFGGSGSSAPPGGGSLDFGASGAPAPSTNAARAPTNAKEAVKQGLDLVDQVTAESTFYPRAKYLAGLLHYLSAEDQKAVESFQEVVRVLNPREGARLDPKLREMAFLSLARIHYGYKQFNRSVYYYDLIDRDSENWLTALFEASWADYRRGDFDKALGNLLTLHSPFFEREYFPESQIVKAIIYFEACRYPETRTIVDDFIKRFTQLMREMQKIVESKDAPEQLYDRIAQLQNTSQETDDDVAARVVSLTLKSSEIRQAREMIKEVDEQKKQLAKLDEKFKTSALGNAIAEQLNQSSLDRARNAGEVTRRKFEQELYKLKSLLAQALRIKIEVARAERETLEKKVQHQDAHDELVQAAARTVVDDEHVYWPYEGEYWRDELGTYELDFSMCRPVAD